MPHREVKDEVRGGARGGLNKFSWDSIKDDRNRICYLGNSVKAPVGRWQVGKDVNWFQKPKNQRTDLILESAISSTALSLKEEQEIIRKKELEIMNDALSNGFGNINSTPRG